MATNNLLNKPAPSYQSFVDNQVLTDNQLNDMLDHLNYQDQLSRVLLSGVGIVCGLSIEYDADDKDITVTQGAAVTTAGNLLTMDKQIFTAFKQFDDSYAKYSPFAKSEDTTLPLWELETDASPSNVQSLDEFSAFDLADAVGILYLEDYLEEDEDCSPVNCNTQGRDVIQQVRVLIVEKKHVEQIISSDTIITSRGASTGSIREQFPHFHVPRIILGQENTATYSDFLEAYEISFKELADALDALASLSLFREVYEGSDVNFERDLLKSADSRHISQYVFDFYRDLADAYNELREMLLKEFALCCPSPTAFAKHVMLGSLQSEETTWRHSFYPSPSHGHANSLDKMKHTFGRILQLIENFGVSEKREIKITPSREDTAPLGGRAIPYYYELEKGEQAKEFMAAWKHNNSDWIPNYYREGYPADDNFEPLNIHLKDHDFYRIEGHLGHDVHDSHKKIQQMQREHGLAFDVIPVAIGNIADEETINFAKFQAYFEDLQVVLTAWNEEQDCVTQTAVDFLSKFSTANPGEHKDYVEAIPAEEADIEGEEAGTELSAAERMRKAKADKKKSVRGGRIGIYAEAKEEIEEIEHYFRAYGAKTGSSESDPLKSKKEAYEYRHGGTTIKGKAYEGGSTVPMAKYAEKSHTKVITYMDDATGYIGESLKELMGGGFYNEDLILDWYDRIDVILSDVDPDIRKLTGTAPGKLIGLLTDVQQRQLENIEDFNSETLANYIAAMRALCQEADEIKTYLEERSRTSDSEVSSKQWVRAYFYALDRILAHCCITEKVKVLYEKVMERKQDVLNQFVLRRFIRKHPGAEHRAGVAKGGTFILLYYSPSRQQKYWGTTSYESSVATHAGAGIQPGRVVGDLCLPYICCTDMPSTTFVFPETPASLRLPVDHICMPDDGQVNNILLTARPVEGTIKAFIGQRELSGAIVNQNGENLFNPKAVDTADYGKPIRFTVNDQLVEPMLTLYEQPQPAFTYSFTDNDFNEDHTRVLVTFTNESDPFNELSFTWDFDGEIVENESSVEFKQPFEVQPGATFDFDVSLTASNGPCEKTFSDTVTIEVPPMEEEEPNDDEPPVEDDPEEPPAEDTCEKMMITNIKESAQLFQDEYRDNQDLLEEVKPSYMNKVLPIYKNIIREPNAALSGDKDDGIFGFIRESQITIKENIGTYDEDVQQEFALKMYYEFILLYVYVQACRDGKIDVDGRIADVSGDWLSFTDGAINNHPNALNLLLDADPIHVKLTKLDDEIGDKFEKDIHSLLSKVVSKLKDFSDG